jgi:DNA gyrase subunit A
MRVVIELKRKAKFPRSCSTTCTSRPSCRTTFGINMVALVDGQPRLLNLRQMLECVPRRTVARS